LVLNPWNVDAIQDIEKETSKKTYTILQLRLHPSVIALRDKILDGPKDKIYEIDLKYITSRGKWYHQSWKGDFDKSGGIATNIGVHFFDMLTWIFGDVKDNIVNIHDDNTASGCLILKNANINWFLSIDYNEIPDLVKLQGKKTYRIMKIENQEIDFSDGFTELHTKSYESILNGNGFGIELARKAIQIVHDIRSI
jgi:UDP-N-acetyl-2-amino-2-deoxyglucuronate dehydrogenase